MRRVTVAVTGPAAPVGHDPVDGQVLAGDNEDAELATGVSATGQARKRHTEARPRPRHGPRGSPRPGRTRPMPSAARDPGQGAAHLRQAPAIYQRIEARCAALPDNPR